MYMFFVFFVEFGLLSVGEFVALNVFHLDPD